MYPESHLWAVCTRQRSCSSCCRGMNSRIWHLEKKRILSVMPKPYAASWALFEKWECRKFNSFMDIWSDWTDEKVTFSPTNSKMDQNRGECALHGSDFYIAPFFSSCRSTVMPLIGLWDHYGAMSPILLRLKVCKRRQGRNLTLLLIFACLPVLLSCL